MRLNEIYIKRGPNKVIYSEKELELFNKIETLKTKDLSDFENKSNGEVTPNSYRMLESLANQLKKEREEEALLGTDAFWILMDNENEIRIKGKVSCNLEKTYKNKEEFNKDFISLHDFLSESTYVGRYFRRTKSINNDRTFMIENGKYLVLYKNNNIMILLNDIKEENEYVIVTKKYLEDGNYEFYGEINEEYRDIEALTIDITKRVNKQRKTL